MRHMLRLLPLPRIVVDEKRDRKRLAHLLTERSPDGELVLQRRSDGACVHLGERGCTVYEQRPSVRHTVGTPGPP